MNAKEIKSFWHLKDKPVLTHTIIGILSGYFFLHPVTMVVYGFETSNSPVTFKSFMDEFPERFMHFSEQYSENVVKKNQNTIFIGLPGKYP